MGTSRARRARPEDVRALGELSDRVFRPTLPPGAGMPVEFPRLFHADNAGNLYLVEDSAGNPVSMVGTYPSELVSNGIRLTAVSIGSVATLPDHRGRGYATEMLEMIIEDHSPHHSIMLVSGGRGLYARLGCVEFGTLLRAWWEPADWSDTRVTCRESAYPRGDASMLHRLYQTEAYRVLRTPIEMESYVNATTAPRFRARPAPGRVLIAEREDTAVAYAVAAPGREGAAINFLEWAGDRAGLLSLAQYALRQMQGDRVEWRFQPGDRTLGGLLAAHRIPHEPCPNQGTIALLNPERLLNEVNPWIEEQTGQRLTWQQGYQVAWSGSPPAEVPSLPTEPSRAALTRWFFSADGVNVPLVDTGGLSYI